MHPWQTNLARQLEELYLIQCSLLPGEKFAFVLNQEDLATWTSLLDAVMCTDADSFHDMIASLTHPPCQARFEFRAIGAQMWIEVALPPCTDLDLVPGAANTAQSIKVSVKGEHISRDTHERWNSEIRARIAEIDETSAFPVYELLTQLTAALHQSQDPSPSTPSAATSVVAPTAQPPYHALLTSHHLVSPTKRRTMRQLSSQLGITGFAKVGYPGIIYTEGPREAVEVFVRDIKAMQWLALRVRFVEPVPESESSPSSSSNFGIARGQSPRWVEVSKIGEVLELMRIRGREALVTDLGIGASSKELR